MQSEATRAAFTLSPIYQRRDQHRITSVAVLQHGSRVFLGLENGVMEEHTCLASTTAGGFPAVVAAAAGGMLFLRLLAEKKVFSKQALADISAAEAAARLVCLSEEGQVALVSLETFAVVPLPAARGATAVAVQSAQHLPILLCVAVKSGKGRSKVLVFNILPGSTLTGGHQPAVLIAQTVVPSTVLGLTWAGRSILLAVPGGYQALTPVTHQQQHATGSSSGVSYQLTVLADHLHDIRTMLGGVPDLGLALMLWEENMVLITDATGAAVREPLQLPLAPLALTAAGLFVVALCDDGVHVFDRSSSREVQHIDFAHDDAYAQLTQRLPTAADAAGKAIVVATSSSVFRLEPIAIEQQVRELLKRKRFDQALQLISSTPPEPSPAAAAAQGHEAHPQDSSASAIVAAGRPCWQHTALAQAGLLLLLECEFDSGLTVLEQLPSEVWQPCQLFTLFPGITARWLSQVPDRSYWGLHGHHLPALQRLVTDMLELKAATAATYQRHSQQHRSYHHQQHQHTLSLLTSEGGSSSSLSSGGAAAAQPSSSDSAEIQGLMQQAKTAVAGYLSRIRSRPHVMLLDGVDTLLLQLLCDVGDAAAVEALVISSSNAAVVSAAAAALRAAGRWHALALLLVKSGQAEEALGIWQSLSSNDLTESSSTTGAVAAADGNAAAVAVSAAAAAMSSGPDSVSLDLLLSGSLRWLLSCDAAASLAVLQARSDLDPQVVMKLLEEIGDTDLKWQYLYHQVHHSSSSSSSSRGMNSQLHTQLAVVLLAALADLIALDNNSTSSSQIDTAAAAAKVTTEELAAMVQKLPLLLEPNAIPVEGAEAVATASGVGSIYQGSSNSQMAQTSVSGLFSPKPRVPTRLSNRHSSVQNYRKPSLMGAGVPSALYFAASVAELNNRVSRSQDTTGAACMPLRQQQQHVRLYWQQEQQPRLRQQRTNLGALAGDPVLPSTAAAAAGWLDAASLSGPYRQGIAAQAQLLNLSFPGQGSPAGLNRDQPQGLPTTQSNIAQVLLQQMQHEGDKVTSSAGNKGSQQQGSADILRPGLRALPADIGPWPLQLSHDQHDSSSNPDGSSITTPPAATAAEAEVDSSGADESLTAAYEKVLLLRCLLVYHLQASLVYDVQAVLSAAAHLPLYPELALLYSRASKHPAALTLLALFPPRLVEGAIDHCRTLGSGDAWLTLLELFLNPRQMLEGLGWLNPSSPDTQGFAAGLEVSDDSVGSQSLQGLVVGVERLSLEPDYGSACRVLNAEGASLNPLRLLAALPADMPLHLAGGLLGSVVCGLQHRRRYGQVVRNLHRSRRLATHADLVQLQSARVLVTDDTACNGCGRFIGSKVFYRYPSGVVVCSRCSGAVAAAGTSNSSVSPVPGVLSATVAAVDNSWELL